MVSERLAREWSVLVRLAGRWAPVAKPLPSPAAPEDPALGASAQRAQENRELLREVFSIVLVRDPMSPSANAGYRAQFVGLLHTLNQGASLEGVYNGLTHSSAYRELELRGAAASDAEVLAFARLLAGLEEALPAATVFDSSSARPLKILSFEELANPTGSPAPAPSPSALAAASVSPERYAEIFKGATRYTLKRVAGDEALKVIAAKKASPGALAAWYGKWVLAANAFGVDFGIPLRHHGEEEFHRRWANEAPLDRLTWEVLTRVHRILNAKLPQGQ